MSEPRPLADEIRALKDEIRRLRQALATAVARSQHVQERHEAERRGQPRRTTPAPWAFVADADDAR